ncbi:MAG: hypothetical protein OXE92_01865 [Bacteroidetes bacterium]|nr:hypothetical protein [Bacteroidota bacterium]MCY4204454.1 hypothetical protein [Bacteroidota bacterium]
MDITVLTIIISVTLGVLSVIGTIVGIVLPHMHWMEARLTAAITEVKTELANPQ